MFGVGIFKPPHVIYLIIKYWYIFSTQYLHGYLTVFMFYLRCCPYACFAPVKKIRDCNNDHKFQNLYSSYPCHASNKYDQNRTSSFQNWATNVKLLTHDDRQKPIAIGHMRECVFEMVD